jgi:hypothetical protein
MFMFMFMFIIFILIFISTLAIVAAASTSHLIPTAILHYLITPPPQIHKFTNSPLQHYNTTTLHHSTHLL